MRHSRQLKRAHLRRCASRFVTAAYGSYASFLSTRAPCTWTLLSCLLFIVVAGGQARASVEGSPHDLIAQGYDVTKGSLLQERCTRCHLATSPANQGFLPAVAPVLERAYGASSIACFSCHDGTTIVSPVVDASRTAFHPRSHGNDLTGYEGLLSEEVGLPHLTGKHMECVTCHDPHDNGHRPFLRADIGEICLRCHSPRSEFGLGEKNSTGNHPLGGNPAKIVRKDLPLKVLPAFMTPFPLSYPASGGRTSAGVHWDLGGHLSAGGSGTIVCVTCHAVHGDEKKPPVPALLAVDPVRDVADLFCEGCHAGVRGDGVSSIALPNPGGTTTGRTYHPVDDDLSNKEGRIVEVTIPNGWPLGKGDPPRLVCSTCHRAHAAEPKTAILRPAVTATIFCENCHALGPIANHHPFDLRLARCLALLKPLPGEKDRSLTCARCHRAHNAGLGSVKESRFVPILTDDHLLGCLNCHPAENPTCEPQPGYRSSHFLGDSTVPETYGDLLPPLRRTVWPESRLFSLYDGENEQILVCYSCHTFNARAVVSGDKGTQRYLLARSGNTQEWNPGEEDNYLCLGCHGLQPGTGARGKGHSHPLMGAMVEKLRTPPVAPMTPTPNGHVNCDSCHRPHGADTRGGVYIMEVIDSVNVDPLAIQPIIDFTAACRQCHNRKDY